MDYGAGDHPHNHSQEGPELHAVGQLAPVLDFLAVNKKGRERVVGTLRRQMPALAGQTCGRPLTL